MRITRTDDAPEAGKRQTPDLQAMDVSELQAKHLEVLGVETISRNKKVLIDQIRRGLFSKDIKAKREARKQAPEARAEAAAPITTDRLTALTQMNLAQLREEYQRVYGKPSLSRNRKVLLKRIAEKLQAGAAAPESPTGLLAKPTLTVKFERKGGKKADGKGKGRTKAKAATQGKGTAAKRNTTRPAGQRDPRLPKAGTDLVREWHGKKYVVRVLEQGFEYQGKPYRSLSALAKHITGQIVNGFAWFGLTAKGKQTS